MAWTKAKTAIVAGVVVLLAAVTVVETIREVQEHRTYPWQVHSYDARVLDQAPPQVRILPVKETPFGGYGTSHGKIMGIRQPAKYVVKAAYCFNQPYTRILLLTDLPEGSYDFISSLPEGNEAALQQEVKRRFGVVAKRELQDTNVFLLRVKYPNRLLPGKNRGGGEGMRPGQMNLTTSMALFALDLENFFHMPVLDRTGLAGDFAIDLKWDEHDSQHRNPDGLKQALTDELGLELVPSREVVEMLVVERAN